MYNANYMDGVPVKIAEKYKPPPPIYKLPQSLANKINLEDNFYWNCPAFSYDLELEKKALLKIEQWKRIRQCNKEQRRERNVRRDQQRKREYEDAQKNLLYRVSYPSTDELSSEEEADTELKENGAGISEQAPKIRVEETVNSFHNILQPTVLSLNTGSGTNSPHTVIIKPTFDSKISNTFNYKDFEDDTSSPFDNIELKTINDLDVLAQVLHNTQIRSPADEKLNESGAEISNDNSKESDVGRRQVAAENIPKHKNNLPRFNYDFNSAQETVTSFLDHQSNTASSMHQNTHLPHSFAPLSNSNISFNYSPNHCNQSSNRIESLSSQTCGRQQSLVDDQTAKSKSVPDIIKELRDEIRKSEIRRYRNCSCNMEDSQHNVKTDADSEDTFIQLDSKAKQLVKQISAMGFPLKRVARIVQLIGTDDKKVVEHLIPLSELVDLGFEESKISDALIRNENNKNKALDDLIS